MSLKSEITGMRCSLRLGVDKEKNEVIICKKIKDVGNNHWTWDLRYIERMNLNEFRRYLSYGSRDGTWASVAPKAHLWAREVAKIEVLGNNNE
jgi:hypothetical protein